MEVDMIKTAGEITGDIFEMLRNDDGLASIINGNIYIDGYRPRDSKKEDAVVIFTTGDVNEIQEGVITIHIYVIDEDFGRGYLEKDEQRALEIERATQNWVDSLSAEKSCYKFSNYGAVHTIAFDEIHQHAVVAQLRYRYYDN